MSLQKHQLVSVLTLKNIKWIWKSINILLYLVLLLQAPARSCINSPWLYTDVAVWGGMSCHWCDLFKFMYFTSKWFMLESHALLWDSYFRTIYFQYFQSYISLLLNSIPSYLVNFFQLVAQTRKDLPWHPRCWSCWCRSRLLWEILR